MNWTSRVRSALTVSGREPDDDVVEELTQHARGLYESARAEGLDRAAALGRVDAQIERWRGEAAALHHKTRRSVVPAPPPVSGASWFAGTAQDARYAFRVLRRQPRFALLVILTMAVGVGTTTVLFSLTYGVLMKPLPWADGDRLIVLEETRGGNAPRFGSFSNAAYLAWRGQASTVEEIGAWSPQTVTLTGAGDAERIPITNATASLFTVLGVRPLIGSLFSERDEVSPVIVLSEGLWRQRFGGDPNVLGRIVHLDGEPHTIIGVMSDRAAYPDRRSRAWIPFRVPPPAGNLLSMFEAVAKLRPAATVIQAAAEGTARGKFVANTGMTTMAIFGGDGPVEIRAVPLADAIVGDVRRPLIVLLAAVLLLLAIAVTNVAGLQLARATNRRRELAIRAALGAGSRGAVRPLVFESLQLAIAGGVCGLALAWTLQRSAVTVLPADFPRLHDFGIDVTVVLFTAATAALASFVFGVLPTLRFRKLDVVGSLAEDRMPTGLRARSTVARVRLFVLAGQVAIACILLVGASLLGRSFVAMLHAERGFDPSRVLSAVLPLPDALYTRERRGAVVRAIVERLERTPGVRHVAFTSEAPLTPGGSTSSFTMRSRGVGAAPIQAAPRLVDADYFATLGLKLVAGRSLDETDTATSQPVAVVNETFVKRYLGEQPLGAAIPMGVWGGAQRVDATIVGVVEDIRYVGSSVGSLPEMYFSARQLGSALDIRVVTLLMRGDGDPSAFATSVRTAMREADPSLVPASLMTLEDRLLSTSLARPRLYAVLLGCFAAVAVLVTAVGLFGVLSYAVAQRTHELGIRSALGARRIDLIGLVLRDAFRIVVVGVAIGVGVSVWSMRSIEALLYGVRAGDAMTYVAVLAIIAIVSILACLAPALRAARLDPLSALRSP